VAPNPLRNIPSLNELLESPQLRGLVDRISRSAVVRTARKVIEEITTELQTATAEKTLPSASDLAERIARRVVEDEVPRLRPAINATGALFSDELGEIPLAEEAIEEMIAVAREYAHLGLELDRAKPSRQAAVEGLLREMTGAEAALVLNSATGALVLTLAATASGRQVLVARGQVAETDGVRLPDLVAAGGAILREVGAANHTLPDDFGRAIGDQTAALMRVEPTDFAIVGASADVGLEELVALAHRSTLPVIHDLGFGGLIDVGRFGFQDQPVAAASIKTGADLVVLRGQRLLGGPPCGILLGRQTLVEKIGRRPLAATWIADKIVLAGLAATLRLYRDKEKVLHTVPLLQLLSTSPENLKNRAQRLAPQIEGCDLVEGAEAVERTAFLAGVDIPKHGYSTWCVRVKPAKTSAERLANDLRFATPAVLGRIDGECLLLDLRTVLPRHDVCLVDVFRATTNKGG